MARKASFTPNAKIKILKDLILKGINPDKKTEAAVFLSPGQEYFAKIEGNNVKINMANYIEPVCTGLENVEIIEQF